MRSRLLYCSRQDERFDSLDKGGKPILERVMAGLKPLERHAIEFNPLTVVPASNVKYTLKIYDFPKEHASGFVQFIPLVECVSRDTLHFAAASKPGEADREVALCGRPGPSLRLHPTATTNQDCAR